ncbi:MAG: DNA polymerase ligase N-terminal domain-containing protein [Methanomassiliicoccales archaeon]|jgi:DNA ligase D-like protein (predicted 3'-phosphoesterase)|nr:3'-phosphoesterase [Methanomassiliicoccales archaeon]MDH7509010.1 DNA polymerase ligase N-terminal domain-containing protein [Methanomassiliicoccales archaeon]
MALDEYKKKRNFIITPEPEGSVQGIEDEFVIQEHHASHLHFDFRLSLDGVLKSWAIPKGVPLEKGVKRLAVETEDHPIEYLNFEGVIPEGQYGSGEVKIWDRGKFHLVERTPDRIVIDIEGTKLRGRYALIRFKGKEKDVKNWLLIKTK